MATAFYLGRDKMIKNFIKKLCTLSLLCLSFHTFGNEIDLLPFEHSFYSQNGEDGVLAKLLTLIPPTSKFCVEFGAYDGITGSNTCLLRKQGWTALLLDRMYEMPNCSLYKEFITADNINSLFAKYQVPCDIGVLSIDIDYNDFYIWKAIDPKYQPAIVVIEYNASHLPDEDKVVKYRPYYCGDGTNYYGAGILALYRLGRAKGYSLVYAESRGVNLFFVRDDLLADKNFSFKDMNDVDKLYRYPTYGSGPNGGHAEDTTHRAFLSSTDVLQ